MQITQTVSEGLKRELKVVVAAQELDSKLTTRLEQIKDTVRIKGFRPGKVPVAHLRRVYGSSVMAEVVQGLLQETIRKTFTEREERPAFEPNITLPEDKEEIEKVMQGKADLNFTLSFEVIPPIALVDFSKFEVEKEIADVPEEEITKKLSEIAENNITYKAKDGAAADGDQVTIDFVGRMDGEIFEGGSAEDAPVVIGQNMFIPGFEEGLLGAKAGEERDVKVTFPEDYGAKQFAGKDAVFSVKVKEIAAPEKPAIDDELAKSVGLENLEKLREVVSKDIREQNDKASKVKLKRKVLDLLDDNHKFDLPPTLVDEEFKVLWDDVEAHLKRHEKTFEDEKTTEEAERTKYRGLAERRVRLGLILNEIGEKNQIKVQDDDIRNAMFERARQFPGQERRVLEMFQKNPQAIAQLKAPIFEEKVINLIAEQVKVKEKKVSTEDLFKFPDEEDFHLSGHSHSH